MSDTEFLEKYFLIIGKIWQEYFDKSITLRKRDEALAIHRSRLARIREGQ